MYVNKNIFEKLISDCPDCPPETGGILGGQNGVVTLFEFDTVELAQRGDFYIPNIIYLNSIIAEWQTGYIEFLGVFHTHPKSAETLSGADRTYIERIMQTMPESVSQLYFPVVIPRDDVYAFSAYMKDGQTVIQSEPIIFI